MSEVTNSLRCSRQRLNGGPHAPPPPPLRWTAVLPRSGPLR